MSVEAGKFPVEVFSNAAIRRVCLLWRKVTAEIFALTVYRDHRNPFPFSGLVIHTLKYACFIQPFLSAGFRSGKSGSGAESCFEQSNRVAFASAMDSDLVRTGQGGSGFNGRHSYT